MKFGSKPTIADKAKVVADRYGKTLGTSKGVRPAPKATVKVKPKGSLKKGLTGASATWTKKF